MRPATLRAFAVPGVAAWTSPPRWQPTASRTRPPRPYTASFSLGDKLTDNMLGSQRPLLRMLAYQVSGLPVLPSGTCRVWTQVKRSSYEVASQTAPTSGHGGADARK